VIFKYKEIYLPSPFSMILFDGAVLQVKR